MTQIIVTPKDRKRATVTESQNMGQSSNNRPTVKGSQGATSVKSNGEQTSKQSEVANKSKDSEINYVHRVQDATDNVHSGVDSHAELKSPNTETESKIQYVWKYISSWWTESSQKKDNAPEVKYIPELLTEKLDCRLRVHSMEDVKVTIQTEDNLCDCELELLPKRFESQPTTVYVASASLPKLSSPRTFLATLKKVPSPSERDRQLRKQMEVKSTTSAGKPSTGPLDIVEEANSTTAGCSGVVVRVLVLDCNSQCSLCYQDK